MSNDPDLLDVWDEWEECFTCNGEGVIPDVLTGLDIDCPACDGDGGWERRS